MKSEGECFFQMAISNGKITALANDVDVQSYNAKTKIDLQGKTILPAFTESHMHFVLSAGPAVIGFNVSNIGADGITPTTITESLEIIQSAIKHCEKGKLNIASNFMVTAVNEKRLPTKDELDKITEGYSLVVYAVDGHSCACNTSALELLGISSNHSGLLTGQEHDFMMGKISDTAMAGLNLPIIYKGIANLCNHALECGFSTICCLDGNDDSENDIVMTIAKTFLPKLDINTRLFSQYADLSKMDKISKKLKSKRVGGCGVWEIDGSVGSMSAKFDLPYKNKNTNGKLYYNDSQRDEMFKRFNDAGYSITTHAIGSEAIAKALDSFEKITIKGNPKNHRLDHAEFPYPNDVQRIIDLGLGVAVQPGYAWFDWKYQNSYSSFLEDEIMKREIPIKRLVENGVNVLGSSDSPVQDINPFLQMMGMIEFPIREQRLSKYQALQTYTIFPAKSLGEEQERGTLEIGKNADFAIFADDYFKVDTSEIINSKAENVYIRGKLIRKMNPNIVGLIKTMLKKSRKI